MFKASAAAAAAVMGMSCVAASAADLWSPGMKDEPVLVSIWTGFYAGGQLGAAWSNFGVDAFSYGKHETATVSIDNSTSLTGIAGGQVGYNWQAPDSNFVFGIEADIQDIGGVGERSATAVTYGKYGIRNVLGVNVSQDGGFAGDVTGRLGYACGNRMIYVKGGFAWFNPDTQAVATGWDRNGARTISARSGDDLTGWTVGAGLEWMVSPNWSVKAEYLYYEFGGDDGGWNAGEKGKWSSADLTVGTAKFGLNYHLTSVYAALN